jgi:DnaJ family protein A protein 2
VLPGEADQSPGQQAGDIVFTLVQTEHPVFKREGSDLAARIEVTLAEALCGFSRVVIKHLDGRGLLIKHQKPEGKVLRPGQVIKVLGEGMPYKKSDLKGDLYLTVDTKFPDDEWVQDEKFASQLRKLLPSPKKSIEVETVDEVEHDDTAKMEDFGTSHGGQAWVDEDDDDDEAGGHPQCAPQ